MASKSHFFRQSGGLRLLADYQFNNNLIDDANGYNLTGTDITYDNSSAVFNGTSSVARRTDTNDIFSFTDGVNDLPFRMELSVQINKLSSFNWLVSKRDGELSDVEWQLIYFADSHFAMYLFSNTNSDFIACNVYVTKSASLFYDIVVDYDGSGTKEGLNIISTNSISTNQTQDGNYTGMVKTQSDLLLGKGGWTNNSSIKFHGKIDFLKIYK